MLFPFLVIADKVFYLSFPSKGINTCILLLAWLNFQLTLKPFEVSFNLILFFFVNFNHLLCEKSQKVMHHIRLLPQSTFRNFPILVKWCCIVLFNKFCIWFVFLH